MNWSEFEKDINTLAKIIDYTPDSIVGIVRGGIIPARLLARDLHVQDVYCLTIKKVGNEREVTIDIREDITNKHILLVEDMLETGKSLIKAKEYLEQKGAIVKTACLYTMPTSEIQPDYFLRQIEDAVPFPWE